MAPSLKIDLNGIVVQLQVNGYKPSNRDNWDEQWCTVGYSFSSGKWLNYYSDGDDVLLSCEVEELAEKIEKLLKDELSDITQITCIEPDFEFYLYPKRDLRKDPNYTYVREGFEIADIYMEWKVRFWNEGLTDNYLSVTLDRSDLKLLLNYLLLILGKTNNQSDEILSMSQSGNLYE